MNLDDFRAPLTISVKEDGATNTFSYIPTVPSPTTRTESSTASQPAKVPLPQVDSSDLNNWLRVDLADLVAEQIDELLKQSKQQFAEKEAEMRTEYEKALRNLRQEWVHKRDQGGDFQTLMRTLKEQHSLELQTHRRITQQVQRRLVDFNRPPDDTQSAYLGVGSRVHVRASSDVPPWASHHDREQPRHLSPPHTTSPTKPTSLAAATSGGGGSPTTADGFSIAASAAEPPKRHPPILSLPTSYQVPAQSAPASGHHSPRAEDMDPLSSGPAVVPQKYPPGYNRRKSVPAGKAEKVVDAPTTTTTVTPPPASTRVPPPHPHLYHKVPPAATTAQPSISPRQHMYQPSVSPREQLHPQVSPRQQQPQVSPRQHESTPPATDVGTGKPPASGTAPSAATADTAPPKPARVKDPHLGASIYAKPTAPKEPVVEEKKAVDPAAAAEKERFLAELVREKPWLNDAQTKSQSLQVLQARFELTADQTLSHETEERVRELKHIERVVRPKLNKVRETKTDEELLDDARFYNKFADFLKQRIADRSYYARLGLSPEATLSQIKKSYHKMVLAWHPDHAKRIHKYYFAHETLFMQLLNEIFRFLDEAYRTLIDEASKGLYDKQLKKSAVTAPAAAPPQQDAGYRRGGATRMPFAAF